MIQVKNGEKIFDENSLIVSKTDLNGKITYGNDTFLKLSEYNEVELLGKPHNITRHPDMPKVVFKLLWESIQNRKEINAYVKNRCKDKNNYWWVFANVTPSFDKNEKIIGYHSSRRKPSQKALNVIKPLYEKLLEIEKNQNIDESYKYLNSILQEKGLTYEEFIISLEN